MFTPEKRNRLREALVAGTRADERIASAALTGSAAVDATDQWLDIDLALAVANAADSDHILGCPHRWVTQLYPLTIPQLTPRMRVAPKRGSLRSVHRTRRHHSP